MSNLSDTLTDKALADLEKRLKRMYGIASNELSKKINAYWRGYTDEDGVWHDGYMQRYIKEKKAYEAGEYTKRQWQEWQKAQIGRGKRWETLRDQMTDRMLNANQTAISMVNDKTPGIYSLNHNYSLYQIESVHPNASFTLVDENTVKRMMEEKNHVTFRILSHDHKADYVWNQKKITNALTQGILQGEHPSKIAKRFLNVMGSNQAAAIRNARTAFTSAQNAGRVDSYAKASDMGIEIEKEWLATSDSRTRDSHIEANGQRIKWDAEFKMEHGTLKYPGDPAGHPAEVYNCRCTVVPVLPDSGRIVSEYNEWLKNHKVNAYGARIREETNGEVYSKGMPFAISKSYIKKRTIELDKIVDKYINAPSQWNNKVTVIRKKFMTTERGETTWKGRIKIREDSRDKTIIHELLHTRSAIRYGREKYENNRPMEEGVVELLAQEICKKENIQYRESYQKYVSSLRKINSLVSIEENDFLFGKKLIEMPIDERYNWIVGIINEKYRNKDITNRTKLGAEHFLKDLIEVKE